ncbi:CRISPR-associated protein Cmr1 [Hydrogenivirga caldilitoris]|uniref:CRISPR-associated protein Cmr1 n=1 Tax=Hydrogenivirga caldilitoris TaxID=246264 RepID=A0A497XP07_9AQUI|nr:type III-B CRISPR module RAMP protein Cmr1 [Hydrogenivirga caldilitoris]RLJ70687.1 CRISPR-associated protein Cmr1 [Hydrogenivirga caldilitoris]
MEKLTFELEFITPAFIGGAFPKEAELKPASFIGLLRWWWRALRCEEDTEKLYTEEAKIFGGHFEDGAIASRVTLRIIKDNDNLKIIENKTLKDYAGLNYFYDKHKRTLSGKDSGIGYLLYSTMLPNRERSFITEGSKFKLILLGDSEAIKHYVASLWCLVFLGGIGTRARRGGGNMNCLSVEPEFRELSFQPEPQDPVGWMEGNLIQAKKIVNGGFSEKELEYSNLCPSIKIAISKTSFKDYKEALNEIGILFKQYREKNKHRIFDMGYFGLPIRHSNNKFLTADADKYFRRSSPLILKVLKIGRSYKWMVVKLNGKFLPDGTELTLITPPKRKGEKPIIHKGKSINQKVAGRMLEEFFDSIRHQAQIKEVSL